VLGLAQQGYYTSLLERWLSHQQQAAHKTQNSLGSWKMIMISFHVISKVRIP
jgi:hypothetical protein